LEQLFVELGDKSLPRLVVIESRNLYRIKKATKLSGFSILLG